MPPVRPRDFEYQFSPRVIAEVRNKLGLSQAKLANILDVPVNTVSRWETGATTPDAHSLAAIYSISKQKRLTPEFFIRRTDIVQVKEKSKGEVSNSVASKRTRLVLMWDFQNIALDAEQVSIDWEFMRKYLHLAFPRANSNRVLRAYTSMQQQHYVARQALEQANFRVEHGIWNADAQIKEDSKTECGIGATDEGRVIRPITIDQMWLRGRTSEDNVGKDSQIALRTVYILATDDGDYVPLLKELRKSGVDVYLWATEECNQQLINAVGQDHFIHWDAPCVIVKCVGVIRALKGAPIGLAEFGNKCHQELAEYDVYPHDVGFRRSQPYRSLLTRLERMGIVQVAPVSGKRDWVTIKLSNP